MNKKIAFIIIIVFRMFFQEIIAQNATIREEQLNMNTYMFSDPSPIPQIGRLYPYSRFDGYTNKGEKMDWKMVVLENDYIKVYVCPDIGGKIYGAIEKSTGKEFLYFNHSVKFRDVAMRGAWTSGGLEYNFGDIGHIPTCATPVDYRIKENEDGSVSCIVGALDLPSRTNWNVEIRLPKDKAYFETKASWFNNTALPVTYYHWMNAAAKAKGNLEFLYPGNKRIGHGGETGEWPTDEGREIKFYENNNFGIYKSYHVINAYSDYFGGYYHDDDFGFGHYTSYDEKPGKKIWIWGLSDQGMIWEDLLTDSDGQYIEYQAGKLFNQAANSSTFTPFKHREFSPHDADVMKEYWFPLKGTKGMVAASEYGVLNVEYNGKSTEILLSALQNIKDTLTISINGQVVSREAVSLSPLKLYKNSIDLDNNDQFEIDLGGRKLYFNSQTTNINRPIEPNSDFDWNSAYGFYVQGLEFEKQRRYPEALELYLKSNQIEPGFVPTLNRLAMSYYRIMKYGDALKFANLALGIDTYDGLANYNYGLIQVALKSISEAKSGFSIASQSINLRSASYTELAKIFLNEKDWNKSKDYLEKALAFNKYNIHALEMLSFVYRKLNNKKKTDKVLNTIESIDASSVFINSEKLFLKTIKEDQFRSQITNELPHETYLELALKYENLGLTDEAVQLLKLAPENTMVYLWLAYLEKESSENWIERALGLSAAMVFPHRVESVYMLNDLVSNNSNWKLKYYLALIYWNKGLLMDAKNFFDECEEEPDMVEFYLSRAKLFSDNIKVMESSLEKAASIDANNWRVNMAQIEFDLSKGNYESAHDLSKKFMKLFPDRDRFGMYYAKALMGLKLYEKCISFLNKFDVLPYEGATEGRAIYHEACIRAAYQELGKKNYRQAIKFAEQAKLWPRNLGVGKHYDVDERLDNYIIAYGLDKINKKKEAKEVFQKVMKHKTPSYLNESSKFFLQLAALKNNGEGAKAKEILELALHKEPQNNYLKWVKAKIDNNNPEKIKDEILNSSSVIQVYDTKFVDIEFELLNEFLSVINYKYSIVKFKG